MKKGLKDKCVDLSDYNRYLNEIWYRTQIPHYQHAVMAKFTTWISNLAAAAILDFGRNINNSGVDKNICTKFYGRMHHAYAEMTTWSEVETGS